MCVCNTALGCIFSDILFFIAIHDHCTCVFFPLPIDHQVSQERAVKQSPPQVRAAGNEQKTRRQKQLEILLQRQQIKEQKLQEYLEKQKQKEKQKETAVGDPEKQLESNKHQSRHAPSSQQPKSQPRDVRSRERGQLSLKVYSHQSDEGASLLSRHHSDAGKEQSLRERKMEERDVVRSWAKAQRQK